MYNKKCKNTFLFLMALLCLITFILPFMNVAYVGEVSIFAKITYYFTISLYIICLVGIILIGVFSLFKNNYMLIAIQEILAYTSLFLLILNLLIFTPGLLSGLSAGFSILALETFIMAVFDDIFKLIKKLPKTFRKIKNAIKNVKQQRLQKKVSRIQNESENNFIEENEIVEIEPNVASEQETEEVKIIPPDEDLI